MNNIKPMNNPFASRGSLILQAALSDKKQPTTYSCQPNLIYFNRQPLHEKRLSLSSNTNNHISSGTDQTPPKSIPTSEQSTSTSKDGSTPILTKRKPLLYSSEKRRKLSRKEVIFSDPIVTEKFTYEPTIVLDDPPSSSSSCSSNSDLGDPATTFSRMNITIRNKNLYSPAKMRRTNHIRNLPQIYRKTTCSPLANTVIVNCDEQPRTPPSVRNVRKRPYIDEINRSPVLTSEGQLPISNSEQLSPQVCAQLLTQPLFSPPKVAKIVPYFTDCSEKPDITTNIKKDENSNEEKTVKTESTIDLNNSENTQISKLDSSKLDNSDEDVFEDAYDGLIASHTEELPKPSVVTNCHVSPFTNLCQSLWTVWKQVSPL